jgi:hypothetical protein
VQRRYLSDHSVKLVLQPQLGEEQDRSNNNNNKEVAELNAA